MSKKPKSTVSRYWKSVRKIAKSTGLPIKTIRRDFSGKASEAIRISAKKRVGTSYKAFKRREKLVELEKDLETNAERAKIYYETIERIGKDRVERVVWTKGKPPKRLVKKYGKAGIEEFSREITRGKDKGKMVFYVDNTFDLPLNEQAAFLLKAENRIARITNDLLQYPWNTYRSFWSYFPQPVRKEISSRNPKTPTFHEAQDAAEEIDDGLSDQDVFELYLETFGHSP